MLGELVAWGSTQVCYFAFTVVNCCQVNSKQLCVLKEGVFFNAV